MLYCSSTAHNNFFNEDVQFSTSVKDPSKGFATNTILGRYALPEEIANMAVFLVSEMGRSIVGDIIYMTGGSALLSYEDMDYSF